MRIMGVSLQHVEILVFTPFSNTLKIGYPRNPHETRGCLSKPVKHGYLVIKHVGSLIRVYASCTVKTPTLVIFVCFRRLDTAICAHGSGWLYCISGFSQNRENPGTVL